METLDVAIIGSGMGAMSAARLLSAQGLRVRLYEQHTTAGGMTHEFARPGGWRFAVGLHYLGRDAEGAWMPLFARITDGKIQWADMPSDYDLVHLPGIDFPIPAGEAAYRARLIARFPDAADAITRYFRDLKRASRPLGVASILGGLSPALAQLVGRSAQLLGGPGYKRTADYMRENFRDPRLVALLCAQWGDCALPSHSAFGYHAFLVTHYLDGAVFPVGGSRAIAAAVRTGLAREGSDILTGCRVEEILVEGGRACGLRYRNLKTGATHEVRARWVISDAGVRNTFLRLLPAGLRGRFAPELEALPSNASAVTAFLRMKVSPASLGATGANIWLADTLDPDAAMAAPPGEGQIFASFPSLKDRRETHTIEIVSPCRADVFVRWADEAFPRQDGDYLAIKEAIGARLVARLAKVLPGLSEAVEGIELATPLTFTTYQGSEQGAFYGLDPTREKALARLTRARTPVPGLVLTGQDVLMPGIVPAMISGVAAAAAVLGWRRGGRLLREVLGPAPGRTPARPVRQNAAGTVPEGMRQAQRARAFAPDASA